ncbi:hypothetical protein MSEO_32510 [Mycobacterium seoulense]|uniref:Uncharacterized protein n=1 Tax=Mycobacterium seoulense TaxID=386911 RepID=A0A7I7P3W4_9MYCO|nr:hypothetical protein MSEO_32510 [Mycobacterium seoulense]
MRDQVGRVSEITWSKIQSGSLVLARTQAYAIRQLDAIAETLEKKADLGKIAKASKEAEPKVREWLAVIARCFQLHDGGGRAGTRSGARFRSRGSQQSPAGAD